MKRKKADNQGDADTLYNINGRIVTESEALVPVTDRGFLYGDGVFETLHAYGSSIFRLREHLDRMIRGFDALGFEQRPARRGLERWIRDTVERGGFPEGNVRVTVTRGSGPRGPSIRGTYQPLAVIMVSHFHRRPESHYTDGVTAIMAGFRRQESSIIANLKTTAYIEQIFAAEGRKTNDG